MLARPQSIDFEALFGASPNPYVLIAPDLTIVTMNEAYLKATMRERDDLLGKPMFEAFPSDPESESYQALHQSLERVLQSGERDEIALIRYDIPLPSGGYEERYWSATHTPLLDAGQVAYILQHTVDVTELHRLRMIAAEAGHYARQATGVFQRAHAVQEANQPSLRRRNGCVPCSSRRPASSRCCQAPSTGSRWRMQPIAGSSGTVRSSARPSSTLCLKWWTRVSSRCSNRCGRAARRTSAEASGSCWKASRRDRSRSASSTSSTSRSTGSRWRTCCRCRARRSSMHRASRKRASSSRRSRSIRRSSTSTSTVRSAIRSRSFWQI